MSLLDLMRFRRVWGGGPRIIGMEPPPVHYSRSPITEAILDLQAELKMRVEEDDLAKPQWPFRREYPKKEKLQLTEGMWKFGPQIGASASASTTPHGFEFQSPDGKQRCRSRPDGFSFHRLAPYTNWVQFRSEARKLWTEYRSAAKRPTVKRMALRYINRFDIAGPVVNLETYFRTYIEISRGLPQTMAEWFLQAVVPLPEIQAAVAIKQTSVPAPDKQTASILLDIDVFRTENIPGSEDELWAVFEQMRVWKNRVFNECLTPAAVALIE